MQQRPSTPYLLGLCLSLKSSRSVLRPQEQLLSGQAGMAFGLQLCKGGSCLLGKAEEALEMRMLTK